MVNAGGVLSISAAITSNGMKSTIAIIATNNTCLLSESEIADIDGAERVEGLLDFGATCYVEITKTFGSSRMGKVHLVCRNKHYSHLELWKGSTRPFWIVTSSIIPPTVTMPPGPEILAQLRLCSQQHAS